MSQTLDIETTLILYCLVVPESVVSKIKFAVTQFSDASTNTEMKEEIQSILKKAEI